MASPNLNVLLVTVLVIAGSGVLLFQKSNENPEDTSPPVPEFIIHRPQPLSQEAPLAPLTQEEMEVVNREQEETQNQVVPVTAPKAAPAEPAPSSPRPPAQEPLVSSVEAEVTAPAQVTEASPESRPESRPEPRRAALSSAANTDTIPDDHYLIQVLSSPSLEDIERFLRVQNLPSNAFRVSGQLQNRPWHAVVLGPFTEYEQARAALNALPEAMKARKPWIRKAAQVNQLIKHTGANE